MPGALHELSVCSTCWPRSREAKMQRSHATSSSKNGRSIETVCSNMRLFRSRMLGVYTSLSYRSLESCFILRIQARAHYHFSGVYCALLCTAAPAMTEEATSTHLLRSGDA